ncbi:hypothetical protein [Mycobacterium genavense]|uniref:hypothetical protein n=1 Tax=Mycobacterium genavense TaxID=36812 RepID=UPI00046FD1BA|nr:hypothetical protein [Mycobacterium genavense]
MDRAVVAAVGLFVAGGWVGMPAAAADNPTCMASACAFVSPSRNISCEVNYQRAGLPDEAYCQTMEPPQSVQLSPAGVVTPCQGTSCLGNPGENTPTLAYGQSANIGPFSCISKQEGVTCTVSSGNGFALSNAGITSVG